MVKCLGREFTFQRLHCGLLLSSLHGRCGDFRSYIPHCRFALDLWKWLGDKFKCIIDSSSIVSVLSLSLSGVACRFQIYLFKISFFDHIELK